MKVLVSPPRSGKTVEVIRESSRTGQYILVINDRAAMEVVRMAIDIKADIPYPVTLAEIRSGSFKGTSLERDGIIVDDAALILQALLPVPVNMITISKEADQ